MAEDYKAQLSKYDDLIKTAKASYTNEPTEANKKKQADLISLKNKRRQIEKDYVTEKWYGTEEEQTKERETGLLERSLNLLGTPLYATVGAAEILTGEGTKKGLSNIISNIKERETFGDLLRKKDIPNAVSMPLGFMMDIAFDPVMWATAGTSALVPRIVQGIKKAGVEGAKLGLKSGVLTDVARASKLIPGAKNISQKLGKKAYESRELYNTAVGRNVEEILAKRAAKTSLGDKAEKFIKSKKGGETLVKNFKLGNRDWFENSIADDLVRKAEIEAGTRLTGSGEDIRRAWAAKTGSIVDDLDNASSVAKNTTEDAFWRKKVVSSLNDGGKAATDYSTVGKSLNPIQVNNRLAAENSVDNVVEKVMEKIRIASKEFKEEELQTGVKWYDDAQEWFRGIKVKDKEVGKAIADSYNKYMGIFKTAKVPLNPSAYTNAIVGNVVMGQMGGLNMYKKSYLDEVKKAFQFINGKMKPGTQANYIKRIMDDPDWAEVVEKYPSTLRNIMGIGPDDFARRGVIQAKDTGRFVDSIIDRGREVGKFSDDVLPKEVLDAEKIINEAGGQIKYKVRGKGPEGAATQLSRISPKEAGGSSLFAGELMSDIGFSSMVSNLEKSAKSGNKVSGLLHAYFTKPMDLYSTMDQSYKLGTAMKLTKTGVTERELLTLKNFVKISPDDVIHSLDYKDMWKIKPKKALEIVNELYMNYSAMPGAVKVLRSLPFFGAPFSSFMYGMGVKTGKTAIHNPAVFNKIQWALKEVQGEKSPLEQEGLESKYYQWYNNMGMVKLPFFQENPVYLNLANMIPYYTMNMLQPSERTHENSLTGSVMSIIDKTPFFKTPEGQVMLDYFVQPLILKESNPRGMFDQPLWPQDATALEKAGYAARSFAEAPLPSVGGIAGIPGGLLAPKATEYVPSFRYRQLAHAVQGKTTIGAPTQENRTQKTLRTLSSIFGMPIYTMNLRYNKEDKK